MICKKCNGTGFSIHTSLTNTGCIIEEPVNCSECGGESKSKSHTYECANCGNDLSCRIIVGHKDKINDMIKCKYKAKFVEV